MMISLQMGWAYPGCQLWLFGSVALGPVAENSVMARGMGQSTAAFLIAAREQKAQEGSRN